MVGLQPFSETRRRAATDRHPGSNLLSIVKVQDDRRLFSLRSDNEEIVVFASLDLDFPKMAKRLNDLWNSAPMPDD
jgi:hypothetical protein